MTTPPTPADEMREALESRARAAHSYWLRSAETTGDSFVHVVDAVLVELRRRGAWIPGDPVTEEMVEAGKKACPFIDSKYTRAIITAALESRKP